MAKGNANPNPSPSGNPNANPSTPPPPPPPAGIGKGGPTGNSGFSMSESSMQGLQNKAGDLQSRLSNISSGLRGLNFSGNALGPIGLFAVPALNASNDNAVAQADRGAKAFGDVQSGLKATANTAVTTDTNNQSSMKSIDTSNNYKPVPNGAVNVPTAPRPGGPNVAAPPPIPGGPVGTQGGPKTPGGPNVSAPPPVKGGGPVGTSGGPKVPGGPNVSAAPTVSGGPVGTSGGPKTPGGPSVSAAPPVKGGGPVGTPGGVKGPSGGPVSVPPVVGGNTGGVPGGKPGTTPGGKGVGPIPTVPGAPGGVPGGRPGAGPVSGPIGAPPVVSGGANTPGGKGGATPGGKGVGPVPTLPGAAPGAKPGVTPTAPGPQSAVTSPSTGGSRSISSALGGPAAANPGVTPGAAPMAPGANPGAQTGDRSSKFTGPGKGVFDAPKPGTPNSTITNAPGTSPSTPPPAPKPTGLPSSTTPTTPGPQSAVTSPSTNAPRGTTPPPAPAVNPAASAAPPVAPGANPAAGAQPDRSSKFTAPGAGKGVFDAPKPPTPDNTITKAPGSSPSVPPPAPKPTPSVPPANVPPAPNPNAAPPPVSSRPAPTAVPPIAVPPTNAPSPAPAVNTPPVTSPNPNAPQPNTRPAPTNAPSPNPAVNTPPASTRSAPNVPSPDTNVTPDVAAAPITTRPAPTNPNPNPAPSGSANPSAVVPAAHPAAAPFQAGSRPKGAKRALFKKWTGIAFIAAAFKSNTTPAPAPAPAVAAPPAAPATNWPGLLNRNTDLSQVDPQVLQTRITEAIADGKPAKARVLIGRAGTDPNLQTQLQQHYDAQMAANPDTSKVEVPKQLHFAWFGNTPSPGAVDGMLAWANEVGNTNGDWKATLWTDQSANNWNPAVVQALTDAGIEINQDAPALVDQLSDDVQNRAANPEQTPLKDIYAAAQADNAKAYNLAADIARYAVLANHGGVYLDVDIRPGGVSLNNIGDMTMRPDDVPLFAPRLRDQESVKNVLGPDTQLNQQNIDAAADIRYGAGELNNNFIVAPPNSDFINAIADTIPKKFESLQGRPGIDLAAELKNQAPDVSGPNVLIDSELSPTQGLIGKHAVDKLGLGVEVSYMPHPVPLIGKTDTNALFDPAVKNSWTGLEWVTPESSNQLDTDTRPRQAPSPHVTTPPPPPPATTAPPKIKSGGAPPPLAPPDPNNRGKDVISDPSWRHDPAKTADWFAPNNDAVSPDVWADRRGDANTRTVDTEVADVTTDSTPSKLNSYQGIIKYDLARIEVAPGKFVQEYTVKVHLGADPNVDPKVVEQVKQNAHNGVNSLLNQGFRLPSGDQFHVNLEFTDNAADAHTTIEVADTATDQLNWNPNASPEVLAHETLHYLGVPDEYRDNTRVFLNHDTSSGVHQNDGGMMGADVLGTDPGLRPRHLWLIENTANSQVMVPDTRLDAPGPATVPPPANVTPTAPNPSTRPAPIGNDPNADNDSDTESDTGPTKRPRFDSPGADVEMDEAGPSNVDSDIDIVADQIRTLSLNDVQHTVHNQAFADLAHGPVSLPTRDGYLADLKNSVENGKPPSFVVNMIVGHGQLGDLNDVINSVTANAGDLDGKVAIVIGVNGRVGQDADMTAALNDANNVIAGLNVPVALVQLPMIDANADFPFGDMRNQTMTSPATQFAVGALKGNGTHPYLAIQDFDTASRDVPGGKHVFTHVAESLSSPDIGVSRPLSVSGGYRVGDPAKLVADTNTRIDNRIAAIDTEVPRLQTQLNQPNLGKRVQNSLQKQLKELTDEKAKLQKARPKVNANDFAAKFEQAVRDDMSARQVQAQTHPLLPYGPEPNLFVDAVVPLVDPAVRFGHDGAEFDGLGKSMNEFNGRELVEIHTTDNSADADPDSIRSLIETDAQNNRNPVRGPVFTTDFVSGAVETDLSRLALGLAKDGKLPQTHAGLPNVMDRYFGADSGKPQDVKAAKGGTQFKDVRDNFSSRPPQHREPLRPGAWNPPTTDTNALGAPAHNTLSKAVSAPLPGDFADVNAGLDPNAKAVTSVNVAMSAPKSTATRTFLALQHEVLPNAQPPRTGGLFQAVQDATTGRPSTPAATTDLRAKVAEAAATTNAADIAKFLQDNEVTAGDLVNSFVEPGPTPQTQVPASLKGDGGEVEVENGPDPNPPTQADLDAQTTADAQQAAQDAKTAANGQDLAGRAIASHFKRPLVIHNPDGSTRTLEPFGKKTARRVQPINLDSYTDANGRTSFRPHESTSRAGMSRPAPTIPNAEAGTSANTGPTISTVAPTPNPVIPMTTIAPPAPAQVLPDTNLPKFFQDNKALGSIAAVDVQGANNVTAAINGIKPGDAARIENALKGDFESFLGHGRNFQVKIGNQWFEANVRAAMNPPAAGVTATDAPSVKVDMAAQTGSASATTHTVATANDVGGAATAGVAMGPYGSLGGKAQLATPAVSQGTSTSVTDQRAIRSGEGSKSITVPVTYEITLTNDRGGVQPAGTVDTGTNVTLQIPNDLSTIVDSDNTSPETTPPDAEWGAKIEHPAPEAVSVDNPHQAFADVARTLHPSITKIGSPGREALQNFLSPTEIRNNLGAMLSGYVTSPDLVSPHAGKGAAVEMKATLKTAELVGTHDSSVLRLHDTSSNSSGVTATTKTGFDVTAGIGGNIGVPGTVAGQVGGTLGYSARTADTVNAGTNTSTKSGIQIKGDTGLYKVTADVEVRTPSGANVTIPVTTHVRLGLPEAGALGLPTPDGTRNTTVDPTTAGTRFAPPYLADAIAAGNAKVGEFLPANQVQGQVETALRGIPGLESFLPKWNDPHANPRSSKGKGFADVAEQLANQRKLTAHLSPAALKTNMDSLMGAGVQVQLKNSSKTTNTYVNVTVKAKLTNPNHLGQADARNVRNAASSGPKLDSATTTTKGWSGGVEGKVVIPKKTGIASVTPTPQVGAKYNHTWSDKSAAGPTVTSTSLNVGSPNAQVFQHDVEFEVEVTTFTRPRSWVRRVVPGAPGFHAPQQHVVASTNTGLPKIDGKVNLWVSDSSTLSSDPGTGFKPGDPDPKALTNAPTVRELLNPSQPRPKSPEFLHVEAVANTTALRDQAIDALNRAANGDSALTVPGTASRAQIDKMFSPENIKANLRKLVETGMQEPGLKYDRRVTDRTGAIGVSFELSKPKLVSISNDTGTENAFTGGYKAGESSSVGRSVDLTGGINVPVKPNAVAPPAGQAAPPSGAGGVAVTGKVTPWSDSKSTATEVGGSVDRNYVTPPAARTVLIQLDADVTVVGESRAGNFVHGGTPRAEGAKVHLPKSVFVRVSEDVARDLGVLPNVTPNVAKPDFPTMAPPKSVAANEPGALGLSTVERVPDLSSVVSDLTQQVNQQTGKKFGGPLVPDSVLKDSMSNLQRLVDLSSPTSVKAMIDSALDGGVPLLVHQPGTFGKDSFQVTLRAKAETPTFNDVVNDGVDMEHTISGTRKTSDGQGRGTGWGVGIKAPGLAQPGSANPNVSGTAGVIAGANFGHSQSSSVTSSTTGQVGHLRAASGPAARYTVPVEFELVVERGNQVVAKADSGKQEMVVRLHADNQKVTGVPADTQPYMAGAIKRGPEHGTPDAAGAWQQDGKALPTTASVENLRGANDLRDAAVRALTAAGANQGLTGKGTAPLNTLLSTLSPENLQPSLPGMLSGPLDVPGLHEAALTFGKDADVKVYAKLVNPKLGAISDNVKLENPTTQVTATSGEAKVTESADVSVGLATGSAAVKQHNNPNDTVGFSTGGVELRHASEDSGALSGGPTDNKVTNPKPATRTGLVEFDVEYRVVATIGGKTGVVDLAVPGSAAVRMPATEAETVLGKGFDQDLNNAQTELKDAADKWRAGELAVDSARHFAQDTINDAAAKLAETDNDFNAGQIALNDAITAHEAAKTELTRLEQELDAARAPMADTRQTIRDLNAEIGDLSLVALETKDALDDARAAADPDVDAAQQAADNAHNALVNAQQQLDAAHAQLEAQRATITGPRDAVIGQQQAVRDADSARAAAQTEHDNLNADRTAQETRITDAEAALDTARRDADALQQKWWDAKKLVDWRVDTFNNPPPAITVTPADGAPPSDGASGAVSSRSPQPPSAPRSRPAPTAPAPVPASPTATPDTASPNATPATRGPSPERSFTFTPGTTDLTPQQSTDLNSLAADLAESTAKRAKLGYQPPKVEVSGPNAAQIQEALTAELGDQVTVTIAENGRPNATDVHVDWDLQRPEGYVPPAPPKSEKVTDTVITSDKPQAPHPILGDESWRHSTAPTADWARPDNPVAAGPIQQARDYAPVSTVRAEDGGVLTSSTVRPGEVELDAWRGPICYDKRTFEVDGKRVQDYTVKIFLDSTGPEVDALKARTQSGVESMFNQGHRLPSGDQFHVTVEFTNNPAEAHGHINVTKPDGRANQLNWPVDTDARRLAHEVGHFLGLQDEYFETGSAKPVFQDSHGRTVTHLDGTTEVVGTGRVVNDNAPMTDGIDAPNAEIKPRNLWLIETRSNVLASPNLMLPTTFDSSVGLPNAPVTANQQTMLDKHGVITADVPGAELTNAIAATMAPDNPQVQKDLVAKMAGKSGIDEIAAAAGARLFVLGADGRFTEHGNTKTGQPVHVVKTADGYAATKDDVHIGRPEVSYPGPTKLEVHGQRKTVHRGEFEVETIAGVHHVRIYTAVVNPAVLDPNGLKKQDAPFKDIQQNADGKLVISPGNNAQLWAGAGRPQRALQWLAKYEHTDGGKPIVQGKPDVKRPVLRSFLVPLDKFTEITKGSTLEGATGAKAETDTYNVDQRGEPNQFGIGGDHLEALIDNAADGSLISYPSNPAESFASPDLAGRIVSPKELYGRLGISSEFRTDALGKAYDPWFSWEKQDNGSWKFDGFRNDAHRLHEIATELREHHVTWQQTKQGNQDAPLALIAPDAESIPNPRPGTDQSTKDTSYDQRVKRLNQFLNEVGPASANVDKITSDVLSTAPDALREHLAAHGAPNVDTAALNDAITKATGDAARDAARDIDSAIKQMKGQLNTRTDLENLRDTGFKPRSGALRTFSEHVVDTTVDKFAAKVQQHPDLALLDDASRQAVADALKDRMRAALSTEFGNLAILDPLNKGGRKGGWLSGPRLTAFGNNVATIMESHPAPQVQVSIDSARLADVAQNKVLGDVVKGALDAFTGQDLASTTPDQLKAVVANQVLPTLTTDIATALRDDPSMTLADPNFRATMGAAVSQNASTRAHNALQGFTFDPVDASEVDEIMAKVPEIASQAEIGALIAADSDRIALDFNTKVQGKDTPFENSYHQWKTERPKELARQRVAGEELSNSIAAPDRNAQALVDQLIAEFDELGPKFDEVCTVPQLDPGRKPGEKGKYTFYEHAQMVLGQYFTLTANENAANRLIPPDVLAKAILFHDIEKNNAKNQFGDGQGKHDAEPEHKLAVQMMDRYRGLWGDATHEAEFQAAKAIVDSDPFGFYLRGKISADEAFTFLHDLSQKIGPPNPDNAQKLFNEFHQYYQADFSSYTTHSRFTEQGGTDPQPGPNAFTDRFEPGANGIQLTPDGRHFQYVPNSDAAQKMQQLGDMFRDADTIRQHRDRIRGVDTEAVPPSAPTRAPKVPNFPDADTPSTSTDAAPSTPAVAAADPVADDIRDVIAGVESHYRTDSAQTLTMYTHLYDQSAWAEQQLANGRPVAEVVAEVNAGLEALGVKGRMGTAMLPDTPAELGAYMRQGWTGVKDVWASLSDSRADQAEYVKSRLDNDKEQYVRRLQTTSQTVVGRQSVETILGDFFFAERNTSIVKLPGTEFLMASEQFSALAEHHAGDPDALAQAMKAPFQDVLGKLYSKYAANTPEADWSKQSFQHWLGCHQDAIIQSFPGNTQQVAQRLLDDELDTVGEFADYFAMLDDDPDFQPPDAQAPKVPGFPATDAAVAADIRSVIATVEPEYRTDSDQTLTLYAHLYDRAAWAEQEMANGRPVSEIVTELNTELAGLGTKGRLGDGLRPNTPAELGSFLRQGWTGVRDIWADLAGNPADRAEYVKSRLDNDKVEYIRRLQTTSQTVLARQPVETVISEFFYAERNTSLVGLPGTEVLPVGLQFGALADHHANDPAALLRDMKQPFRDELLGRLFAKYAANTPEAHQSQQSFQHWLGEHRDAITQAFPENAQQAAQRLLDNELDTLDEFAMIMVLDDDPTFTPEPKVPSMPGAPPSAGQPSSRGPATGPRPERSLTFAPGQVLLTDAQRSTVDTLARDLADTAVKRTASNHLPPKVEVSGGNALAVKAALDAKLGGLVEVTVADGGRPDGADVHVDWDLRPATAPTLAPAPDLRLDDSAPHVRPKMTAGEQILADESWRHSEKGHTEAAWTRHPRPVDRTWVDTVRSHVPPTRHVSESGGLTNDSRITVGPDGRPRFDLATWGGPIGFETRRIEFNGTVVQDRTFRIFLDNAADFPPAAVENFKQNAKIGIDHFWNRGYALPRGDQLNVNIEFTTNPNEATGTIRIAPAGSHPNQLNIPIDGTPVHFAHEIGGHFGGLDDQYAETRNANVFQHSPGRTVTHTDGFTEVVGRGRVVHDNGIMGPNAGRPGAEVKPRDLWLADKRGPNPDVITPANATEVLSRLRNTPPPQAPRWAPLRRPAEQELAQFAGQFRHPFPMAVSIVGMLHQGYGDADVARQFNIHVAQVQQYRWWLTPQGR